MTVYRVTYANLNDHTDRFTITLEAASERLAIHYANQQTAGDPRQRALTVVSVTEVSD